MENTIYGLASFRHIGGVFVRTAALIFPHQIFYNHPILNFDNEIIVIEEHLFFNQYSFHKGKLAYHRATLTAFYQHVKQRHKKHQYIESHNSLCDVRRLIKSLAKRGIDHIHVIDPTDYWLKKRIIKSCEHLNIQLKLYDSPLFLNTHNDNQHFFKGSKKKYYQTSFYKAQRKSRNILITADNKPTGGKWTYDVENRKRYPKKKTPPSIPTPLENPHWSEAVQYVNKYFPNNPGILPTRSIFPIEPKACKAWLNSFLEDRFHDFGAYEDAIVKNETFLHHTVLSPMLNIGLITPDELIDTILNYAETHEIPINSTEGLIRQLIGWREFVRGMYEVKGVESRTRNFWNFKKKIPHSFYTATTGIDPVDDTIKKVLETGYCHHIERLMVLGNFMLLCEIDPDEVFEWFMELFIDAYDWVMVPNVYGMSQFADGGFFASKPYISSSNYILKMSNYTKGPWQKPWDGLFWRFLSKQRAFFSRQPRLKMLLTTYDKMTQEKKDAHQSNAEYFLAQLQ